MPYPKPEKNHIQRWFKRSGERVSEQHVVECKRRAVHAKRYGYPKSPHAIPGMSAQPDLADALERMTLEDWSLYSGAFTYTRLET